MQKTESSLIIIINYFRQAHVTSETLFDHNTMNIQGWLLVDCLWQPFIITQVQSIDMNVRKRTIITSVKLCFLESPSFRHFYIKTNFVEKKLCGRGVKSSFWLSKSWNLLQTYRVEKSKEEPKKVRKANFFSLNAANFIWKEKK